MYYAFLLIQSHDCYHNSIAFGNDRAPQSLVSVEWKTEIAYCICCSAPVTDFDFFNSTTTCCKTKLNTSICARMHTHACKSSKAWTREIKIWEWLNITWGVFSSVFHSIFFVFQEQKLRKNMFGKQFCNSKLKTKK